MRFRSCLAAIVLTAFGAVAAHAQPTAIPDKDTAGADLPWLKRYAGSLILDFRQNAFDEADFVAGPLKPQEGLDVSNNALRVPEATVTLQGRFTRFVYLLPEGRGPLEAVAGYKDALADMNAETLFECKETACGGAPGNAVDSGGNTQGLIQYVVARDQIPEKLYSPGWCVLTSRNTGQRYALIKADGAHVAVFAAKVAASGDCLAFDGRTIAIVTVLEDKAREQNMETVSAEKIGADITAEGRVVLYGVLFDTDKATMKPESKPQLDEIAAYLKANPDMRFIVVGHTDNEGAFDYNVTLSQKRAASIIKALRSDYKVPSAQLTAFGAGMAAPVATNTTDEGKALNRRVEIVVR